MVSGTEKGTDTGQFRKPSFAETNTKSGAPDSSNSTRDPGQANTTSAEASSSTAGQPTAQVSETKAQPGKPLPNEEQEKRATNRKVVFTRLILFGLVAAIAGGAWWYLTLGHQETEDAYVEAHISNLSSRISGTVTKVLAVDNQIVKAGEPVVILDPNDYNVRVEQAEAAVEEARHQAFAAHSRINQSAMTSQGQTTQADAEVSTGQAQIATARFQITQAKADIKRMEMKIHEEEAQVRFAEADFERYKSVYAERVVTKQQFDKAKETYDIALAQLQQAHNSLEFEKEKEKQAVGLLAEANERLAKSKGGVTAALATTHQQKASEEEYAGSLSGIKKAEAALKQAKLDLSYTTIVAPVNGRIGRKSVEIGQHIEAGQLMLAIVQSDIWVTANFKETQVGKMVPGQKAEIKIDSFPGQLFTGLVDSISPASGAKFSMLPPDNATGNFTKVVQRMSVKIHFDPASIAAIKNKIAPGMSCVVTVFTKPHE